MTIPNCFNKNLGCDNWATDSAKNNKTYTRERNKFIKFLDLSILDRVKTLWLCSNKPSLSIPYRLINPSWI
jgi:hypothetical protein